MKIMKFGGSSLGSGERILHVAQVIKNYSNEKELVIIVSAMYGVTDSLISIFNKYKARQLQDASDELALLFEKHEQALHDLHLENDDFAHVNNILIDVFKTLRIHFTMDNNFSPSDYDYIISFGERFSSILVAAALRKIGLKAMAINGSEVIVANNYYNNAKALLEETSVKANLSLRPLLDIHVIPVVTGFFAATKFGEIVTLGRGGSDYSATILAHALDASEVILWKEVDGVYSDDPKKVAQAKFYSSLSYKEALRLAQKGAKVLHYEAMKPVALKEIIVWVRNTFKPENIGTKIWKEGSI